MRQTGIIAAGLILLASTSVAFAVGDEIQVYTGGSAAPGTFNLTWHNNYAISGTKTPDFPGGLVSNHTWNGVTEWAYGVTPWFEAGLYLPLYSFSSNQGAKFDGFKLRALFVNPNNETSNFYYGVNFEFSWNETHWDQQVNTGEIRPIIGWRGERWSLTLNPILDNTYKGFAALTFAPATRLDYTLNQDWTIALEHYADMGELRGFLPTDQQSHQLFAVVDYGGGPISVEAGLGFGLTKASDDVTFKLILATDLNGPDGFFTRR
jgi:hypothetical protein